MEDTKKKERIKQTAKCANAWPTLKRIELQTLMYLFFFHYYCRTKAQPALNIPPSMYPQLQTTIWT